MFLTVSEAVAGFPLWTHGVAGRPLKAAVFAVCLL